jgi:hypothetical protein
MQAGGRPPDTCMAESLEVPAPLPTAPETARLPAAPARTGIMRRGLGVRPAQMRWCTRTGSWGTVHGRVGGNAERMTTVQVAQLGCVAGDRQRRWKWPFAPQLTARPRIRAAPHQGRTAAPPHRSSVKMRPQQPSIFEHDVYRVGCLISDGRLSLDIVSCGLLCPRDAAYSH